MANIRVESKNIQNVPPSLCQEAGNSSKTNRLPIDYRSQFEWSLNGQRWDNLNIK
jgi:hypothetical protein